VRLPLLAFVCLLALSACSSSEDTGLQVSIATETPNAGPPRPATASPLPATEQPNRKQCDAIRGTSYLSDDERAWFILNCPEPPTATVRPQATASMTRIVTLTSPVRLGETATLFARTSPGATCDIIYYTPLGNRSMVQGLVRKPADSA
jgi:hypothetical protein